MDKDDVAHFRDGLCTGGAMKDRTRCASGSQHGHEGAAIHQCSPVLSRSEHHRTQETSNLRGVVLSTSALFLPFPPICHLGSMMEATSRTITSISFMRRPELLQLRRG